MIYEHFAMRLHNDSRVDTSDPASWAFKTQDGVLSAFVVGQVDNPKPEPKMQTESIAGANGVVDLTEAGGRVTFGNKTVTVILSGEASFQSMDRIETAFAPYQGRMIDFTFDDVLSLEWYQTGRMTAQFDRHRNRVTLTLDCSPYRYGGETTRKQIAERGVFESSTYPASNTWEWRDNSSLIVYDDSGNGQIAVSTSYPGIVLSRRKTTTESAGDVLPFGIKSIIGGDVWFEDAFGTAYRTFCPISEGLPGESNYINMYAQVDGSHYEWVEVNGELVYSPTLRVEYVFAEPVSVGSDGYPVNTETDYVTEELPTNVIYRPRFRANQATIIIDGAAIDWGDAHDFRYAPRAVLPGNRNDLTGETAKTIFCIIPNSEGEFYNPLMEFQKVEVF